MNKSSENVIPLSTRSESGTKAFLDEQDCVEILHRALIDQTDEAWEVLQQCFSETVRIWRRCHPSSDVALLRDSEANYIAQTFSRFWYAVRKQHIEFTTVSAALRYLQATLNGLMIDTLRSHIRLRSRESPLPEPGCFGEPSAEELFESEILWESIQSLLSDERERRIFYLLYYCGLKPREVVIRCPQEFHEVKEVYRLNTLIIERLRRNGDRLRYLLGDEQ